MNKSTQKKLKLNPMGCLLMVLPIIIITIVGMHFGGSSENSQVQYQQSSKELKDETFEMYKDIYNINTNMSKGLDAVSNRKMNIVDYYDFLGEVKKHSLNRTKFIESRLKEFDDENIKQNLEAYLAVYTKFLMISDNMQSSLDNANLQVLSKTNILIEEVDILIKYIEKERFNLLISLDFTEEEAEEILESESEI